MSFKGSLQTVALPEVLHLLADTGKSGELHIRGSHGEGRVWFDQGRLGGHEFADCEQAFEALFELLRVDDGEFEFASGVELPEHAWRHEDGPCDLGPALEMAQARLAEWTEIVAVVPSLNHHISLIADPPGDSIVMDRFQWQLVVAAGAGGAVGAVLAERGLKEFEGCRAVRDLVGLSLVEISEPVDRNEPMDTNEPVEALIAEVPPEYPEYPEYVEEPAEAEEQVPPTWDAPAPVYAGPGYEAPVTDESAINHYSSLQAVLSEVEASSPAYEATSDEHESGAQDGDASDDYESGAPNRAALHALLAEVTAQADPGPDAPAADDSQAGVDGLADRGPWTSHELSSLEQMGGWRDDGAGATDEVTADLEETEAGADSESEDHEAEEAAGLQPGEEPINRGLLLKFLSSVRS